jgi:hypothetical protein
MVPSEGRPQLEVADIFRLYGSWYRDNHKLSSAQSKVMNRIEQCRTAALGGHVDTCDRCEYTRISYNSCRDRHCPKCQSLKQAEWIERRVERLLPVPYFHTVFTLPEQVNPLALYNKKLLYDLLFQTASQTLKTIAADPEHLGAKIGFTAVLHSWGQNLLFHPHLHCVVTGGGLSESETRWIKSRPKFLLPVRVLAKLFRKKFVAALKKARKQGKLDFSGLASSLADPRVWNQLIRDLKAKDWVVYSKEPFGGPEQVFRYLGRYTHRVAISNYRLLSLEDNRVTFTYKDYKDNNKQKEMTIEADEFIRRFLLHVLPKGYIRIRHYGLLSGASIKAGFEKATCLLTTDEPEKNPLQLQLKTPWWEKLKKLTGFDAMVCPQCQTGRLIRKSSLLPQSVSSISIPTPAIPILDSS